MMRSAVVSISRSLKARLPGFAYHWRNMRKACVGLSLGFAFLIPSGFADQDNEPKFLLAWGRKGDKPGEFQ